MIPRDFFGAHGNKVTNSSTPQTQHFDIGQGVFRMWDCNTQWRKLEPTTKGVFDWSIFDKIVVYCAANNLKICYCYGQPPNWATGGTSSSIHGTNYNTLVPTNMQDWTDYVTAVANRLPAGSWHEHINEPNGAGFYSGTKAELATMHTLLWDAVKAIDPTAKVISAAPSGVQNWTYLSGYLTPAVRAKTDYVGMHGYCFSFTPPKAPEAIFHGFQAYRGLLNNLGFAADIPIIDTEYTWYDYLENGVTIPGVNNVLMSDNQAVSYVARSIFLHWLAGYKTQFPYMLDFDWSTIQFVTSLATPTTLSAAGLAHQFVAQTLVGGTLHDFRPSGNQYTAKFHHRDGRRCLIQWMEDGCSKTIDTTGFATVNDCLGNNVAKSAAYSLTMYPVFCYY